MTTLLLREFLVALQSGTDLQGALSLMPLPELSKSDSDCTNKRITLLFDDFLTEFSLVIKQLVMSCT